jgi:tRNA A-37 threonylcarbamoyl transferase component Bud32
MTAAPDRSLERYEIVDRIAVGGMAEVFRAKAFGAHGFEKTLAIKRILPDFASDPEFEQRFIQEAKLAVQLAHANIVQVFDFGRFEGTLFIAMEYVEGLDLAALLKLYREQGKHIPIGAALHLCAELCKGLDYAHQRGVVHRDVSPSNILLSRSGEVKIADFGIAQAELDRAAQTPQRRIMGKWRYMSPEQAMGEDLEPRSDLFSAGAVMHEVFTGQKLFPGDEAEQVLDNIRDMPIPKVSELREQLPKRLDELLARMLQRDIGERPARAAEIQRALTEVSYESSIVASALDVADTVEAVIGQKQTEQVSAGGGKRGIDDLIKQQIGGGGVVGGVEKIAIEPTQLDPDRHTEQANMQHTQTFVRKGVDADGSTMWELAGTQTIAAVPSAIRGERSAGARATGESSAITGDVEPSGGRRAWMLAGVVALGLALGGGAYFALRGGGTSVAGASTDAGTTVAVVPADAGRAVGYLDVQSDPVGARIRVDGNLADDVTPAMVPVSAGEDHTVTLELDAYRSKTYENVSVTTGGKFGIRETLVPQQAMLIVKSRPPGADVFLAGTYVGKTPFEGPVKPGKAMELLVKKLDHKPYTELVDLEDGDELTRTRTLESTIEYGEVNISVKGRTSWAYVSYKGKRLGRVKDSPFRLPVGKQQVVLENPPLSIKKTVTVEVFKERVELFVFEL